MLPPFIIDQIRRREEEERRRRSEHERPRLELPVDVHPRPKRDDKSDEEQPERGVIIIDLT
jgi:hypothetical protein